MDQVKLTAYSKGGGCGCKIAPAVLQEMLQTDNPVAWPGALLVGNDHADDAAVYQVDENTAIISTTDFFLPIVDDPFDFGKISAANAISDVYAMGGKPLMALAILGWPIEKIPAAVASQVLEGARAVCSEAGIPLAGGHTIDSADPVFGLSVTGSVSPKHLKRNNTAQEGDLIFLTKPLGVGVLATALKRGLLQDEHYASLLKQLTTLNRIGESLGTWEAVHAMTDVTGFGLLGHLIEMAEGSSLSAQLEYSAIQKVDRLDAYLQQRTIPDATFRNWNSYNKKVSFGKGVNVMEAFNLLPDPQTNGGLLVAVSPEAASEISSLFREHLLAAQLIGHFKSQGEKVVEVV